MLNVARKRFESIENVSYQIKDYTKELPSVIFDTVISALSIHHLEDDNKMKLFSEIYDSLPNGGLIESKFNLRKMGRRDKQQCFGKKFCILALILGIMCIISGCRSARAGIQVETQLPENTQLHFLFAQLH